MTPIRLTHAILNVEIIMDPGQFVCCYHSEGMNCTYIVGPGTALVPVKETPEEVWQKVSQCKTELLKGVTNDGTN